ncbi:MAG TPA: class I SAM-dependent methyltransferase [Gemmataceae bacterium]|nr:class I SAM-dependent methyltransferase [Gemmataceae bacterium]
MLSQSEINAKNSEFWNELCGSGLAKILGITEHTPESLRRFDAAYFDIYPYLLPIVNPSRMAGKDVLEIGLGYGSMCQQLAGAGARYAGLDIAAGAVRMTNLRLEMQGFAGRAVVGSAHEMPFVSGSFDFVVSIGCFHHTGNLQRCIDETHRVLRPGGRAIVMVYNKFSLRQWLGWPWQTFKEVLREWGLLKSAAELTEAQKFSYDHNAAGAAAPETVLTSVRDARRIFAAFETVTMQKRNMDPLMLRGRMIIDRPKLLGVVSRMFGLDLYIEAKKHGVASAAADITPLAKAG